MLFINLLGENWISIHFNIKRRDNSCIFLRLVPARVWY